LVRFRENFTGRELYRERDAALCHTGNSFGGKSLFNIGAYTIGKRVLLAPMAGVTDLPFRQLCLRYGAGLATTEMLTSDTRLWQSRKTQSRLRVADSLVPVSMQIAGSEPDRLAQAAQQAVALGAQIVDINMGCPAKKVCNKLAGSALLKNETLVADILRAVVNSVDVPVTLKTRTGWDTNSKNAVRIACMAEDIGIRAITIHGRTRACRFNGHAEYDTLAEVVRHVAIPVIANGDITNGEQARQVLAYTGAQAVMIGRAALGRPWIFKQLNSSIAENLANNEAKKSTNQQPELEEIKAVMIEHLQYLHDFYGEQGTRIARKHIGWYCEYLQDGQKLKQQVNTIDDAGSQIRAVSNHFENIKPYEEKAA
jgi:tRNA-dihydrouridine synthase B